MRNDPYTHFSQQPHNKLTWLIVFYYFFTKGKQNKTKKVIKYYQQCQLVVGLLWGMSVGIISQNKLTQKVMGITLPHRQGSEKLYIWVVVNHYFIFIYIE
jgi:hypothetical protein